MIKPKIENQQNYPDIPHLNSIALKTDGIEKVPQNRKSSNSAQSKTENLPKYEIINISPNIITLKKLNPAKQVKLKLTQVFKTHKPELLKRHKKLIFEDQILDFDKILHEMNNINNIIKPIKGKFVFKLR
jgi:hypothetical protein